MSSERNFPPGLLPALAPAAAAAMWHGHSAKATTAEEARYRIQERNSQAPRILVVPLGERSASIVQPACAGLGETVTCRRMPALIANEALFDRAHAVVIVAAADEFAFDAAWIAERAWARHIMVTGLIVDEAAASMASATVALLRRYCSMLVISADPRYVQDMLEALGAERAAEAVQA